MNKTMDLDKILQCIQDEPELPGEMPKDMQQILRDAMLKQDLGLLNLDLLISIFRFTVRYTKEEIADRVKQRI